jgi:hypothetical protein
MIEPPLIARENRAIKGFFIHTQGDGGGCVSRTGRQANHFRGCPGQGQTHVALSARRRCQQMLGQRLFAEK